MISCNSVSKLSQGHHALNALISMLAYDFSNNDRFEDSDFIAYDDYDLIVSDIVNLNNVGADQNEQVSKVFITCRLSFNVDGVVSMFDRQACVEYYPSVEKSLEDDLFDTVVKISFKKSSDFKLRYDECDGYHTLIIRTHVSNGCTEILKQTADYLKHYIENDDIPTEVEITLN